MRIFLFLTLIMFFCSCDMVKHYEKRAEVINRFENRGLILSRENRNLKIELQSLLAEINQLKSKNHYQQVQLNKLKNPNLKKTRSISSVPNLKNDLVKFDVYKWKPSEVLAVANSEFDKKNYEKSAQYFQAFSDHYSSNKKYTDSFLFQAGVASFESGKYYKWSIDHFSKLVEMYPTSKFLRGAKLWRALAYLKTDQSDQFFSSAEEFRKKYRNTNEWKILSPHYEKIVQRHKKN